MLNQQKKNDDAAVKFVEMSLPLFEFCQIFFFSRISLKIPIMDVKKHDMEGTM